MIWVLLSLGPTALRVKKIFLIRINGPHKHLE
jgi:hypothetical protein